MSKVETCPTCKQIFPFCPDCGRPIIEIKKSSKIPKRTVKIDFKESSKKEICSRCGVKIPKNTKYILEKVYEDDALFSESIVCFKCYRI